MSALVQVVNVFVNEHGEHGNPLGIVWASASTRGKEVDIVADLGFSETIFIDAVEGQTVTARIFTPAGGLPFAGHPTVGLAAWFLQGGDELKTINVPAGSVRVRTDGDFVYITAMPEWAPSFELDRLDSPADVEAVDPDAYAVGLHYVWAWSDEAAHRVRARMFAPDLRVREDEATGSAAIRLSAALGRDLEIVQGEGSVIHTHVRYLGQQIEIGGRVSEGQTVDLR